MPELISDADLKKLLQDFELVPEEDIKDALQEGKNKGISLREALLDKGMISDEHLGQVIADFFKCSFVNLRNVTIPEEVLKIIPEVVAKKYLAICFESAPEGLKVAMVDPTDIELPRLLEKKTGERAIVYCATEQDVRAAFRKYRKDLQQEFGSLIKERIAELEEAAGAGEGMREVPVIKIVDTLLEYGYHNRSSDVHIEPQDKFTIIRFRIDGVLHDVLSIPKAIHDLLVTRIKILSELRTDDHFSAQDGKFRFNLDDDRVDVRVSVVPQTDGEKVVMRLLSEKTRQYTLEDLGFGQRELEIVQASIEKPHGMILATGPTGSGKTTTLYAMLKIVNRRDINIATIEDPVEYDVEGINQIQVNPRTNLTYAAGLKSILRQDPDIIMVGEIRDNETAGLCINAALTGHLVFSTLHTNDAATSLPRLLDMEVEPFLIASTVNVIVAQRLVRRICNHCISSQMVEGKELEKVKRQLNLEKLLNQKINKLRLYKGMGCSVCSNKGFRGRTGIFEVLEIEDTIRDLIMKRANASVIKAQAIKNGMIPMIVDGIGKALLGETTIEEVIRVAME